MTNTAYKAQLLLPVFALLSACGGGDDRAADDADMNAEPTQVIEGTISDHMLPFEEIGAGASDTPAAGAGGASLAEGTSSSPPAPAPALPVGGANADGAEAEESPSEMTTEDQ